MASGPMKGAWRGRWRAAFSIAATGWLLFGPTSVVAQPDPFVGVAPPSGSTRSPVPPPAVPGSPPAQSVPHPEPPAPRAEPRPPRTTRPAPPLPAVAQPDLPLTGPVHTGSLRLGNSVLPLPPGNWVALQSGTSMLQGPTVFGAGGGGRGGAGGGGGTQMHSVREIVLARQDGGRITGLIVAQASTSDAAQAQWFPHAICATTEGMDHRVVSSNASTQDCARAISLTPTQGIGSAEARAAMNALAARRAGFVLPSMLGAQFRFANSLRALAVEYRFALSAGDPARVTQWMAAQQAAIRSGFGGRQAGPLAEP